MRGNKPQNPLQSHYWSPDDKCPGFVYIFAIGQGDLYKIGFSKNWQQRIHDLQASNPLMTCTGSYYVGHARRIEDELHNFFDNKRVEREIFHLTNDDLSMLKDYLEPLAQRFKNKWGKYAGKNLRIGKQYRKPEVAKYIFYFKRALNFFNWLEQNPNYCDGCGIKTVLVASISTERFDGESTIRLCESCWSTLHNG